jgi:Mg/Co/Ni transporter MgtE
LSSEEWLQVHIWAGLLTGVLFAVHIGYRIPAGWFQGILAWLYLLVMASGVFGLFFSRAIPKTAGGARGRGFV